MCFLCHPYLYSYIYIYIFICFFFKGELEPFFVYRPTAEEISASMGVPMEGFFDGADVAFATPTPFTAAPKVPAKTPTPEKSVLILKGLVRLHLFLPRNLLLQREPFLLLPFRPRPLLLFCHLLFSPVTPLRPSPKLQKAVLLWLLLLPPFPFPLHVALTQTYPLRDLMTFLRILMMRLS